MQRSPATHNSHAGALFPRRGDRLRSAGCRTGASSTRRDA